MTTETIVATPVTLAGADSPAPVPASVWRPAKAGRVTTAILVAALIAAVAIILQV